MIRFVVVVFWSLNIPWRLCWPSPMIHNQTYHGCKVQVLMDPLTEKLESASDMLSPCLRSLDIRLRVDGMAQHVSCIKGKDKVVADSCPRKIMLPEHGIGGANKTISLEVKETVFGDSL